MKKETDYLSYTFMTSLRFTSLGQTYLKAVGEALSVARNEDYAYLVSCYRENKKPVNGHRRREKIKKKYGFSNREADSIVYSNNDQIDFVKRTTKQNIEDWNKELRKIEKDLGTLKGLKRKHAIESRDILVSKIKKSENKSPSCCFGGKKLQRNITKNPYDTKLREDWNNKRLFLYFMGNGGRSCGNDIVKIDPVTQELRIQVSEGLKNLACLPDRKVVIGTCNFKNSNKQVLSLIDKKVCTTHQFVWDTNKRKFRLHTTSRIEKPEQKTTHKYHCGVDQNSGFITATIIDAAGNPVRRATFEHSHSKEIQSLVDSLVRWMVNNNCYSVSVENLRGLSMKKRRSFSSVKALNKIVNEIPYGEFTTLLARKMEKLSGRFLKVNPHNTSKNTVLWKEDIFGDTVHEKASYLIARRGIGLKITRRIKLNNPVYNSVCIQESVNNKTSLVTISYHDVHDPVKCSEKIRI